MGAPRTPCPCVAPSPGSVSVQPVPALGCSPEHPEMGSRALRPAQVHDGAAEQGPLYLLQRETSPLLTPHPTAVGIWGALRVEGEQGEWEMPPWREQDPGTSLLWQEEAGVGASQSRGCLCPSLRIPDHRRPSIRPCSPTVRSLTWDRLCFLTPCSFPRGDGAMSLGGCQGGLTAAQVKGCPATVVLASCRLCPGPASGWGKPDTSRQLWNWLCRWLA